MDVTEISEDEHTDGDGGDSGGGGAVEHVAVSLTLPENEHPELGGGALQPGAADRSHARLTGCLRRMERCDSHDYDPADNDLEEEARRSRTPSDYSAVGLYK
jgi:hypothetical protein